MLAKTSLETRGEIAGRSPVAGRPLFLSTDIAFFIIIVYTKSKPRGRVQSSAPALTRPLRSRIQMAKADSVYSTPRRTASKTKRKTSVKAKPSKPDGSKIIEQCVIYVQQLAAYDVGFRVDRTGEAEYCGEGNHIREARRALCKLIGLSP